MTKQKLQSFKWLPLAAVGLLFPTAYLWFFLWCLKLTVSFWMIYTVLYSAVMISSFFPTLRKKQYQHDLFRKFPSSRSQPSY